MQHAQGIAEQHYGSGPPQIPVLRPQLQRKMPNLNYQQNPSSLSELKMTSKKKNDLLNAYFSNQNGPNGSSMTDLETLESQGLIQSKNQEYYSNIEPGMIQGLNG